MSIRTFAACLVGLLLSAPSPATEVRPMRLDEIIDATAIAFHGTVIANRSEREAGTGLIVTYTTFAVREPLKGTVGSTHVIKQIGGVPDDGGPALRIIGVPTFAIGHDYVVFLPGVSTAGFSSPVGLGQGRFSVTSGAGGLSVANGRDLRLMTAAMPLAANASPGLQALRQSDIPVLSVGIADFKELIRSRTEVAR